MHFSICKHQLLQIFLMEEQLETIKLEVNKVRFSFRAPVHSFYYFQEQISAIS